jgi:predicted HTH domain antitoxin
MSTVTVSMRLPRSEVARLDASARAVGSERSAFLKRALQRGAADLMFEQACQAYRDDEATLTRAAEIAGLTLRDMMHRMQRADLELNYGVDELARDLQE